MKIVDGKKIFTIVTINPGSTSTKIGVYRNDQKVFIENIYHTKEELEQFDCVQSQLMYRAKLVENACQVNQVDLKWTPLWPGVAEWHPVFPACIR